MLRRLGQRREIGKDILQGAGIAGIVAILSVILHKGAMDIGRLAQQYSDLEFWQRLARYLIANLAG